MYKKIYYFSILFYVAFFLLAVLFYKERCIFIDLAFHIFSIVKTGGSLAIQNYRFGAVFTQLYPCLATKLSLPLNGVVMSYSLGFACYYFLCYLACGVLFKNYKMGLVLLLFQALFTTHTFYWIQSELPQAIAFCIVLFSSIDNEKSTESPAYYAWLFAAIAIIGFFHPLMLFVFSFMLLFLLQEQQLKSKRKMLIAAGVFYFLVIVSKKLFFSTAYDTHAMGGAKHLITLFPNYFTLYSNEKFLTNCVKIYYWIPVISLLITAFYAKDRNWRKLLIFAGYMLGFLLLVNVSYPDNNTTEFYIENLYLPLSIFIAVPLIYDVLPKMKPQIAVTLLMVIFSTGIIRIWNAHGLYSERLDAERSLLNKYKNEKVLLSNADVPFDKLLMTWGSSYETWLLSTIETGQTASLAIRDNPADREWAIGDSKAFITNWDVLGYSDLPLKYFVFKDTSSTYKIIK